MQEKITVEKYQIKLISLLKNQDSFNGDSLHFNLSIAVSKINLRK